MYLFLPLKGRKPSILCSVMRCFHWLYHCCHSLSLIAICYHSLSLVVLLVVTLYHLLHHSLSLAVIRCHSLYYSLLLVVPLVVTHYHSLSLVVTRCTTRLSFYKRSFKNDEKCLLFHLKCSFSRYLNFCLDFLVLYKQRFD